MATRAHRPHLGGYDCPVCDGTGKLTESKYKAIVKSDRDRARLLHDNEKLLTQVEGLQKERDAAKRARAELNRTKAQISQLTVTIRKNELALKNVGRLKASAVSSALRVERARAKATFDERLATRLAEELERRAATAQQEGCAHEIALVRRLKALFPHLEVTNPKQRADVHLIVGRTAQGGPRGVIVAEEKHQEVITDADVTKAVEGASKVPHVKHVVLVTTARYVMRRRKRQPLHGFLWLADRQVIVASVDVVESLYLYLVGCLEASNRLERADLDKSIGERVVDFLKSPSWSAYMRAVSERYRDTYMQVQSDRAYFEGSILKREITLGKAFYDMDYIRTAIDAVLAKRSAPAYSMPRNARALASGDVSPERKRPLQAAHRGRRS